MNNPLQLLDRLELLGGSILAGNDGLIPELSQIVHLLNQMKVISKKQLNGLLKNCAMIINKYMDERVIHISSLNREKRGTHDKGVLWQTITFTNGMYSYSDTNDYIHQ